MRRRALRSSLTEWCRYCGFEPAAHHKLLIEKLEAVSRGEIRRLAVFMPPGSAKSTYASVLFASHEMAKKPTHHLLAASHTLELAEKWGRRVRNLLTEHSTTLGVNLSSDNLAAGRWQTSKGGEYYAAGVGTGIAGFRAMGGLIDDPIRSRQDADSELIRDRIWDWYINDFKTRLVPGAWEILIQTRWHEDDLAGRALNHEEWDVLSLPALAEPNDPLGRLIGEPLWSDGDWGYGQQLMELAIKMPPRTWAALYQQRPAPEEGDYFRSEWLKTCTKLPPRGEMQVYGGSDYAVTADGGDYTVHVVVGLDADGNMYLLDLWRAQTSSERWVDEFCRLVKHWKPIGWAEETGQIKSGVGPWRDRRARELGAYVHTELFPTRGDKAVRAQSIRGRMAMHGLYVLQGSPWLEALCSELLSFPAGKHDDQVDALGLVGQLLDKMVSGAKAKELTAQKQSGYGRQGGSQGRPLEIGTL